MVNEGECNHTWHEWYASAWCKMRECYQCGKVETAI